MVHFEKKHLESVVSTIAVENNVKKEYEKVLQELVLESLHNVKPSTQHLGDSMEILNYIKIKKIEYKDLSKTKYVNGIIISKNVADRRMRTRLENPRILLISSPLEDTPSTDEFSNISHIISSAHHYIKTVIKKIKMADPTLVIVEKNVSRPIVDELRKHNITLVKYLYLKLIGIY